MIISDQHRFIFIHVPKCAGTTVREALQPYDDTNGHYTNRVDQHPDLGLIDYVHIPLFILKAHFERAYQKLERYDTYAVLRDPFARFPSSLSQRARMYGKQPLSQMTPAEVRAEVEKTLRKLHDYRNPQMYLPYDYIHFQRQVDFVFDDGRRCVRNLYTTDRVHMMLSDISSRHGVNPVIDIRTKMHKANETLIYRNRLIGRLVETLKPGLKRIMNREARMALVRLAKGVVFVPPLADRSLKDIFESEYVRDFIMDYYKEDIRLFDEVSKFECQPISDSDLDAPRNRCRG